MTRDAYRLILALLLLFVAACNRPIDEYGRRADVGVIADLGAPDTLASKPDSAADEIVGGDQSVSLDAGDEDALGVADSVDALGDLEGSDAIDVDPDQTPDDVASPDQQQSDLVGSDQLGDLVDDGSSADAIVPTPDVEGDLEIPLCPTSASYAPLVATGFEVFPDDFFTVDDPSTSTGLRVVVDDTNAPWAKQIPANLLNAYTELNKLNGWGTTAGIYLRFGGSLATLPSGDPDSLTSDAIWLVQLTSDGYKRIPYETKRIDDGATVLILPMIPLEPKTRHAVIVTDALTDANGGCIAPSPLLAKLLHGEAKEPRFARLNGRYAELLQKTGLSASRVRAATVFTTQSIVESSVTIAADIRSRTFTWATRSCELKEKYRQCENTFVANHYRKDGIVADGTPQESYTIPVTIWLPKDGTGPFPTIIYGHGIGGNRLQAAEFLSELATSLGVAVVAIDAVAHGQHPLGSGGSYILDIAKFFAVDVSTLTFEPLVQRDNWRQSTYDKLQLIELLASDPDVDGTPGDELDLGKLGYVGGSLGSIMSNELLALSDRFKWAIITVGGGRVVSIISEAPAFNAVVDLVKPADWTAGDLERAYPLAQTLIDAGDSANYATHILKNRLPGAGTIPPHLLVVMALGDDTVPNVSTLMQVRSLDLPLFEPYFIEPGLVPLQSLPQSLNWVGGTTTAGFFQYDRYRSTIDGPVKKAGHVSVNKGIEFLFQAQHFIETWLANGKPEVIDPYDALETPPLP
ncbi:MAG: hypothetical protein KC609_18875 [Myxococcales bacterium]|nr:hypothetical protein [Myxococcales bacterium]